MKQMVIIGAGIAGLATGCYARMNGFESVIYEMHDQPGGVCASWRRGEYLFDHCLHWVIGSNKGNSLYPIFQELKVAETVEFYHPERFREIDVDGKTLIVYTNIDKLEAELLRLFPDEGKAIRKYTGLVRFYTGFRPPLDADFGRFDLTDMLKMLPYMPSFIRLSRIRIEDFLQREFRNPVLREMLFQCFPVSGLPALMAVLPLAYMHNHEGGYPLGGSLHFARAMERCYLELGGQIRYRQKVKRILMDKNKVVGVITEAGECVKADMVISACDGRMTIYELLEGKYVTPQIEKMYSKPSLWPPLLSISLGVNRDLTGEVELHSFTLRTPVEIAGRQIDKMTYVHYCQDSVFAPKGKSVVEMQLETDYDYWRNLYNTDRERYKTEKTKVLEICLQELERKLPGITAQVEVTDVATPATWERYTGNWRGSYEGWLPTVELFGKFLPSELPGLKNFYMTGQWVFPGGGVPMCMAQARRLVKRICRREGREFRTT